MITLLTELGRIRGITPSYVLKLRKLGLKTVRDLLWHFPFRYDDFSRILSIQEVAPNQLATIEGTLDRVALRKSWKRHVVIVEAHITDETGSIKALWFNQPYMARVLRAGLRVNLAGKVSLSDGEIYFSNPSYEIIRSGGTRTHTGGLIPVYPETRALTSRGIRYLVKPILQVLSSIPDPLPSNTLRHAGLPETREALRMIHFPSTIAEAEIARRRFAFEELFLIQLSNLRIRARLQKERAPRIVLSPEEQEALIASLPFALTASQKKSVEEILADFRKGSPMNRLLEGDVGSGKTAVAALAAFAANKKGMQAVFMAPTEVLARQHYATISGISEKRNIAVGLLVGGEARMRHRDGLEAKVSKKTLFAEAEKGNIDTLIGTHALLQQSATLPSLGLIVVDEQHRFGVSQRAALAKKKTGAVPHFLSMSATPIPRTLSLTLFGDLDLSIINELPSGRRPITTKIVAPENRSKAYAFIRGEVQKGRQAFVICPRIEIGTAKNEGGAEDLSPNGTPAEKRKGAAALWTDVKTVTEEFEKLSKKVFPDLRVFMLHGKMKNAEKAKVMQDMKEGLCDILVATSVIEVGVDIPNANIMIIEGAERFGLAQLYQFRGRIGRGEHPSYCLLFTTEGGEAARARLDALLKAKNGFELAELDLKLRGPGEFLGEKQTGIPDTAMRALSDLPLIKLARESAVELLSEDPELASHPALVERLSSIEKTLHLE